MLKGYILGWYKGLRHDVQAGQRVQLLEDYCSEKNTPSTSGMCEPIRNIQTRKRNYLDLVEGVLLESA